MTKDIDSLRKEIKLMHLNHLKGDITEKAFQRDIVKRTVDLYRAVVRRRMAEDEKILLEHHTIRAHFRVTQSLLKEPEQEAISVFATDRRIVHLRSTVLPDQPPTADGRDRTIVEAIRYENIGSIAVHRNIRWGEIGVGAIICTVAVLFASFLEFTSGVLLVLGGLGILHGLFLPTKWVEIKPSAMLQDKVAPVAIHASRRKSARKLVKLLREKAAHRPEVTCGGGSEGETPFQAKPPGGLCLKAQAP